MCFRDDRLIAQVEFQTECWACLDQQEILAILPVERWLGDDRSVWEGSG